MMTSTLALSVAGCLPISMRGLQQKIVPYTLCPPTRNVNGELIEIVRRPSLKFRSIISGSDALGIPLEGLYLGVPIGVSSVMRLTKSLSSLTPGDAIELSRTPVEKSVRLFVAHKKRQLDIRLDDTRIVYTGDDAHENVWLTYQPYFNTRLTDFEVTTDAWGQNTTWRMTCDEI